MSSRSHAVCIIRLFHTSGMLVLVDCAGSERKKDLIKQTFGPPPGLCHYAPAGTCLD